mmetsp:Transcript_34230/g.80641  ORF Transcript_34230/g.80641 Transcript_34230/m.80641 type:complete len:863 (+) Transcript_34230:103-2691(+)
MRFSLAFALLAGFATVSAVMADSERSSNRGTDVFDEGIRGILDRRLRESHPQRALQSDSESCNRCRDGSAATSRPTNFDTREEIFDQLNPSEYKSVIDFVTSDEVNLADTTKEGLSSANRAMNRNYVVFVQLFPPPKAEAIAYLDRKTDSPPERYAIVTVNRGRQRPRDMMQYKIGPLVNGRVRSLNPEIEELLEDNEIPWAMRGNYHSVTGLLDEAIHKHAYELRELFKATTGGYCIGGDECNGDDKMRFIQYANLATTPTRRVSSVHFILRDSKKEFGPSCLLPVPISFHVIENPDRDPSEWEAINFEYCYQGPYDSAQALLDAIFAGEVHPCSVSSKNLGWTSVDPVEPLRPDATIKEPISFHSGGKRYIIDSATGDRRILPNESQEQSTNEARDSNSSTRSNGRLRFTDFVSSAERTAESDENDSRNRNLRTVRGGGGDGTGHRVSWLGWSFHVSSDQMHGMVLRNLSFKGERLAYELSFQEFFASYSSMGSPGQTVYFDTNWEVGKYSPLELGLDCPEDATLLPIIQHNGDHAEISENLMCIFEQPYGEPMWRHEFKRQNSHIGGIPRTALQIRVVSVLGNYDYIPTLTLMADGVMEVKVEMGGYLQAGYSVGSNENNPEVPWFGTRLRDNMAGLLHDHIVGIKADLDVGGLANTLKAGKIKYGTYEEATGGMHQSPGYHAYNGVKYMDWTTIDSERGISHTDYDAIVVESPTRNQWGAHRSYEIVFEHSIPRQVFPEDHPLGAATAWQYSNVAITRQKDSERYCSFPSNYQVGRAIPSYDLREFQRDQENVVEEDLVFWIMFGLQHYPKAEDVPLVSNFGSGFLLKPRNMYDRAAFEDLPDNRNKEHRRCIAPSRA